jgi:hypothetical protein
VVDRQRARFVIRPRRIALVVAVLGADRRRRGGHADGHHTVGRSAATRRNVYVEDSFGNRVQKVPVGGGSPTTFRSGQLNGVAFDSAGDMFFGQIVAVPEGFGIQTLVAEELRKPVAIATHAVGDLFIGTEKDLDEIPAPDRARATTTTARGDVRP